ncbi:MAG: hypothetical protein D6704_04780 [Nitrospirae bacterium]|nr:MAG: hypothetical protein D6704_04780 [Nitrospirota bacterium]
MLAGIVGAAVWPRRLAFSSRSGRIRGMDNIADAVVGSLEDTSRFNVLGRDMGKSAKPPFQKDEQEGYRLFSTSLTIGHLKVLFERVEQSLVSVGCRRNFTNLIERHLPRPSIGAGKLSEARLLTAWGLLMPWFWSKLDGDSRQTNKLLGDLGFDLIHALAEQAGKNAALNEIEEKRGEKNHSPICELFGYFALHLYYKVSRQFEHVSRQFEHDFPYLHHQYVWWVAGIDFDDNADRTRLKQKESDDFLKDEASLIAELGATDNATNKQLNWLFPSNPPALNEREDKGGLEGQLRNMLGKISGFATEQDPDRKLVYQFTRLVLLSKLRCCQSGKKEPVPSGKNNDAKRQSRETIIEGLREFARGAEEPWEFPEDIADRYIEDNTANAKGKYWGKGYTDALLKEFGDEYRKGIDFLTSSAIRNEGSSGKPSIAKVRQALSRLQVDVDDISILKELIDAFPGVLCHGKKQQISSLCVELVATLAEEEK